MSKSVLLIFKKKQIKDEEKFNEIIKKNKILTYENDSFSEEIKILKNKLKITEVIIKKMNEK